VGWIGRSLMIVAVLGTSAATAFSEEAPTPTPAPTPFSQEELEAALRLRLGDEHHVEVTSGTDGLTITVDGTSRSIVLGDERGDDAARVVALVAAAIVLDGAERRVAAASVPAVEAGATDDPADEPRVPRPLRWSLSATMGHPFGERTQNLGGFLVGHDREVRGVHAFAAAGVSMSMAELPPPAPAVRTIEVPLRVGAWLGGDVAVGASVVALPYNTSGGVGDRNVLAGAGVMARLRMRIGEGMGMVVHAGVDAMASTVEYRWEGAPAVASGRTRVWVALGVAWEGGP
jgi:hypothetical protein